MKEPKIKSLPEDRFFGPDPQKRKFAARLICYIADLPLIYPHGHINPAIFIGRDYSFGSPVDLLIIPDHYILRILFSQGIPFEKPGVFQTNKKTEARCDHQEIWQIFADNYYLFRSTPSRIRPDYELQLIFEIKQDLTTDTAQAIYDEIADKLATPEFCPKRLYKRFNNEVLCATDAAMVSGFLGNFSQKTTQMLRDINLKVFKKLFYKSKFTSITIDIDSSVVNVKCHQEGAAKILTWFG